jgi:hypothetical protein
MGSSTTPDAPSGYTATFNLAVGRYFVTGDTTVNSDTASETGRANCRLYRNDTAQGQTIQQSVPPMGYANVAYSNTFEVTVAGSTTVSFRCYAADVVNPANLRYWFANMTVFRVS